MYSATCLLLAVLAPTAGPLDPSALVLQLGAARYADRESAAEELGRLGPLALSALRSAQQAKDPEVRNRAAALVEKISTEMMVKPTLVKLDFVDQPVADVVRAIGDSTRVTLNLSPENNPFWKQKRITLKQSQPTPFWQAIDRLCEVGGLQHNPMLIAPMGGLGPNGSRRPIVQLTQAISPPSVFPTSDAGPFRIIINGVTHHKERVFGHAQPGHTGFNNAFLPNGGALMPSGNGFGNEQFFANLQVLAEPRLMVMQNGSLKLIEAADDAGNSLLSPTPIGPVATQSGGARFNGAQNYAGPTIQLAIFLKYPARPGTLIKRLRGSIPLTVAARKDDPFVVRLADAKDKTFKHDDFTLSVHDVKAEANPGQSVIELTLKYHQSGGGAAGFGGPEFMAFRNLGSAQSQFEIVDATGRAYQHGFPAGAQPTNDGVKITLRLLHNDGVGPPAEIRYYEFSRANTDAEFDFRDVPMP